MKIKPIYTILFTLIFIACGETQLPKPKGELRLEYPNATYKELKTNCPFSVQYSEFAKPLQQKTPCWYDLNYKKMKGNIHLSYHKINGDLSEKIKESERLAHEHSVKASFITPKIFENPDKQVYGTLFEIGGESAVNFRFHATDSTNHLLSGSVYFTTPPNPDSLAPAIEYIRKDVQHMIESIEWKN